MAKINVILIALVGCIAIKLAIPAAGLVAYSAPLAYPGTLAIRGALIAPGSSSRIDIQNTYTRAFVAAPFASYSSPLAYPGPAARIVAPYPYAAPTPLRYVAAPLLY